MAADEKRVGRMYAWERAIEAQHNLDFLYRTEVPEYIAGLYVGKEWSVGWRIARVLYWARREGERCVSVFGRIYRRSHHETEWGGGMDLPVWWFDAVGMATARPDGYDPAARTFQLNPATGEWVEIGVIAP